MEDHTARGSGLAHINYIVILKTKKGADMYFPSFYEEEINCYECELTDCWCRGKSQRNRRDFSHDTSGRCPKVPDKRGFVAPEQRTNQRNAYPLVYAEIGWDSVLLSLSIPGEKVLKKVYQTKSGHWYYKTKDNDGDKIKQCINIMGYDTLDEIREYANSVNTDYIILPCEIADYTV